MNMGMEELKTELWNKFVSRKDNYAIQNPNADYYKANKDLTLEDIEKHLNGDTTLGLYLLDEDSKVKYICLDVDLKKEALEDSHPSPDQWQLLKKTASELISVTKEMKLDPILEFSGKRGYHVLLFFENPEDASTAKSLGKKIKESVGDIHEDVDIEVFPKQDRLPTGGFGNLLKLPLGIHQVVNKRSEIVDPETFEPIADPLLTLQNIKLITEDDIDRIGIIKTFQMPVGMTGMNLNQSGLERMVNKCPVVKKFEKDPTWVHHNNWIGLASNYLLFKGGWDRFVEISKRDKRFRSSRMNKLQNDLKGWNGPQTYKMFKEQGVVFNLPSESPKAPAGWGSFMDIKSIKTGGYDALTRHFREEYHTLPIHTQPLWIERLSKGMGISVSSLETMARNSFREIDLTDRDLKDIMNRAGLLNISSEDKGQMVYRWFTSNNGTPYHDREHNCYWVWKDHVYEIGDNQPFKTLIWKEAELTHEGIESKKIWAVLKAETDNKGKELKSFTWLFTDCLAHKIYINPNNDDSKLVRITPGEVKIVPNGINEEKVLLAPAPKMHPFKLSELTDTEYRDAWSAFERLILRNMACPTDDQLLYGCWVLCYPLIDYVKTLPHMRCEGVSSAGKTRAMDLVGHFVYGDTAIKKATDAANFADAAKNPLICLDNVETKNFTSGLADFVLTAATGIQKEKRKIGTDHGVVIEKVKCLLTTNGIENLGKKEHITRTLLIEFDRWKYKTEKWSERIYGEIAARRSELCSAHMMLVSRVLKKIVEGGIERWIDFLETKHPGHSKDRANSFLALMAMILEELVQEDQVEQVVSMWISKQDKLGRETAKETNTIVSFLEAIYSDYEGTQDSEKNWKNWGYEVFCDPMVISGTAAQLLRTFSAVAKRKGMKSEYTNPRQLANRIKDAKAVFEDKKIKIKTYANRQNTLVYHFTMDCRATNC
jgi:hypothetical protein